MKKIVFLGDSLTAGYGLEIDQSFPSLIQKKIQDVSFPYVVVNAGISGDTTAGGLARLDWILQQDIAVFVLALGANDALRGFDTSITKNNLSKIIEKIKSKNPATKILLVGMYAPPNLGNDYSEKYTMIFSELSSENNLNLVPFLLDGVAGNPNLNLKDGLHPNEAGYKVIAETVWKSLKPIL